MQLKKSQIKHRKSQIERGFTLFELIVTLSVLAVLVMGTIPLAQNAVKRQREIRLRESLRMMRTAIDEFIATRSAHVRKARLQPVIQRLRIRLTALAVAETLPLTREAVS